MFLLHIEKKEYASFIYLIRKRKKEKKETKAHKEYFVETITIAKTVKRRARFYR